MVGYDIYDCIIRVSDALSKYTDKVLNMVENGIITPCDKHKIIFVTTFITYLKQHNLDRPELNRISNEGLQAMLQTTNNILNTDLHYGFK